MTTLSQSSTRESNQIKVTGQGFDTQINEQPLFDQNQKNAFKNLGFYNLEVEQSSVNKKIVNVYFEIKNSNNPTQGIIMLDTSKDLDKQIAEVINHGVSTNRIHFGPNVNGVDVAIFGTKNLEVQLLPKSDENNVFNKNFRDNLVTKNFGADARQETVTPSEASISNNTARTEQSLERTSLQKLADTLVEQGKITKKVSDLILNKSKLPLNNPEHINEYQARVSLGAVAMFGKAAEQAFLSGGYAALEESRQKYMSSLLDSAFYADLW